MHSWRRWRAITLTLAFFGRSGPLAHAEPAAPRAGAAPPPLTVQYSAPGNCPTEADFEARVQSRTALARFAADDKDAQAVQVVVKPMGVTYAGHLSIVGRSGRVSERDVEDVLCADVVEALALVTALAVDPKALLSLASPPAVTSAVDGAPLGAAAPEPVSVIPLIAPTPAQAPPPVPAPPPTVSLARPEPDKRPAEAAPKTGVHLGATFVLMAGIAPDTLAGGGGFGEYESRAPGWLAPSARLTVFASENGAFATRIASFLLVAGRLDLCPLRIGSREVSLRPCVATDVGGVRAEGMDTALGRGVPGGEPWFDVAALLRARWAPGQGRFFVEIEGGLFVPLNRAGFYYRNVVNPVDTPWPVAPLGSLALGFRL